MLRRIQIDNITKIIAVYFCARLHFYIHIYGLLLTQRGFSLVQISSVESLVIAMVFLMEVPTGVIADRIGRKWSLIASTLLLMCGETLFIFARSYPVLLVIAVLTGTGFAFSSGATEALIHDSLPPEDREEAMKKVMGRYLAAGQIAFFLGPVIGGLVIGGLEAARVTLAIVMTALALLIGVLIAVTLREPPSPWQSERPGVRTILRQGVGALQSSPALRRVTLLAMFSAPFGGALVTTLAPNHLNNNGVSPFMIGAALALGSLAAAFTQSNAYRVEKALGKRRGLALLTFLPGVMYLVLAAVSGPVGTWSVLTFMYATNDMRYPLFSAYQNALIRTGSRATVLSLINMLVNLFIAIMGPLYAALATRSLPLAFAAIGVVILTAGAVLRVDRLPLLAAAQDADSSALEDDAQNDQQHPDQRK